MTYATEWRQAIESLGRWVDFDNDYEVCENQTRFQVLC